MEAHTNISSELNDKTAFEQSIFPDGDNESFEYSPVAVLHAIHSGKFLDIGPPLYRCTLHSSSANIAELEFDVRAHSRIIDSISFTSEELGGTFEVDQARFMISIKYKSNLDIFSLEDIQRITYHMSYPDSGNARRDLSPYISLLALGSSTSNIPEEHDDPIALFEEHELLLKRVAESNDTFMEQYDAVNLHAYPGTTQHKWRVSYGLDIEDSGRLFIGDNVLWDITYTIDDNTFMRCTLIYEQAVFGGAEEFKEVISEFLHTLAPGLPADYRHVVAASISTKQRKAWSTMSEEEIANSRSIFTKLPSYLVEDHILKRRPGQRNVMNVHTEERSALLHFPIGYDLLAPIQLSDKFGGTSTAAASSWPSSSQYHESIPITLTYTFSKPSKMVLNSIMITFPNSSKYKSQNMDTISFAIQNAWHETLLHAIHLYAAHYSSNDTLEISLNEIHPEDTKLLFYPSA